MEEQAKKKRTILVYVAVSIGMYIEYIIFLMDQYYLVNVFERLFKPMYKHLVVVISDTFEN